MSANTNPLRIFVQVWCELDSSLNVRIDRQTGEPVADEGDLLWRISPLGRLGVQTALGIANADVTAFAIGTGHDAALRHALAAGVTRAVELAPAGDGSNRLPISVWADWLQNQRVDVLIGDRDAGQVACRLGWAHLAGLESLQVAGQTLTAIRSLGRGDAEAVHAVLPAAVRIQEGSQRSKYISRARINAVAPSRIERVVLQPSVQHAPLLQAGVLQAVRPRAKTGPSAAVATTPAAPVRAADRLQALLGKSSAPAVAKPVTKTDATPEQMAEEFVRYLVYHDLLP